MRIDRLYSRVISVLTAVALFGSLTVAQTRSADAGSLEVVVKDPSGAVINNARLQLSKDAKADATAQTNQKGEARFSRVIAGHSQIHIEAPGFKPRDIDITELHAGLNRLEV